METCILELKSEKASEFEECAPNPSSMLESMRAHGYTLQTAIADLVDNSITAGARSIHVAIDYRGIDSKITVKDDGCGMSASELASAMRLGSTSPTRERNDSDLGRFGLGLKTASLSQGRRLTVVSIKDTQYALRRWDLDYLASDEYIAETGGQSWRLLKTCHASSAAEVDEFCSKYNRGTMVCIERLDRLVGALDGEVDGEKVATHVANEAELLKQHLEMTFHLFLSRKGKNAVRIYLNERRLEAWDPFQTEIATTRHEEKEEQEVTGEKVALQGFVLPHRDQFDPSSEDNSRRLHEAAAGPLGWNAHQGFFVYRNDRLIIPGDWLGLGPRGGWKKEEHYKLARLKLEIPNSLDALWQIDVKKSTAVAPVALKHWLTGRAKDVREKAKEVYSHRGSKSRRRSVFPKNQITPWKAMSGAQVRYKIDRKHVLVEAILKAQGDDGEAFDTLLTLLEQTIPVERIWIDTAEKPDDVGVRFGDLTDSRLKELLKSSFMAVSGISGISISEAIQAILDDPAYDSPRIAPIVQTLREELEA